MSQQVALPRQARAAVAAELGVEAATLDREAHREVREARLTFGLTALTEAS